MNRKSIQILRGSANYDPSTSQEILLDGQPFYSKKTKKLYIGDGVSTLSELEGTEIGLDLMNSEGELSVQTPNAPGYEEPINGFPEGRLTKVPGSMSAAIGFNHKVYGTGSVGLGAYSNLQTNYSASIGYLNWTTPGGANGRGLIGIGDSNVISSNNGGIAIGKDNKVGHIIQLTAEERQAIVDNYVDGTNKTTPTPGRTHGGYLKNTIYLIATKVSPYGYTTFSLLTEQSLNPSTVYKDPNSTLTYTDKDGVSKSFYSIYRLSAVNSSGKDKFQGAVALGYANRASSDGAIATGAGTWADGFGSFSSGSQTQAHGNNAAVFGYNNTLYGANGFVAGSNHYIVGEGNTDLAVFGRWSENKDNLLFAVGNGTSETDRKNAFTVLKDGRAKIQSAAIENDDILRYQDKVALDQSISNVDSKAQGYAQTTLAAAKEYADNMKNAILGEGISQTFDTLKEIQDWIEGDGVNTIELTTAIAAESTTRENKDLELSQSISDIESDLDSKLSISTIDQTFFDTLY